MATQIDYSNINNYTDSLNNFLAENSENFVNGDRTFNQWTGKFTDSCEYKQRLNLATKPMEYYVNSLNNISGFSQTNNKEEFTNDDNNVNNTFLSFTPIGNAAQQNISNIFDRPIPSTLQTTSSVYTLPYLTSPNLQATNNINTLDTDTDLMLKTGLGLRNKNNRAELSAKKHATYGDIHADEFGVTVQNAGHNYTNEINHNNNLNSKIENFSDSPANSVNNYLSLNPNIPGLNVAINYENGSQGRGILALGGPRQVGISTRNAMINLFNGPYQSCPEYIKNPKNKIDNNVVIR